MEPENTHKSIRDTVAEKIKLGAVSMHSPLHFVLRSIALLSALFGVLVVSTLILNFILFSIRFNGHHELLGFGFSGVCAFLKFFPWPLLVIDIVLIGLVVYLFREFRAGYRIPTLYLGILLFVSVSALGLLLEETTPFNGHVLEELRENRLPRPLPFVMDRMHMPPRTNHNVCHCEVLSIEKEGYIYARDMRTGRELKVSIRTPSVYATTSNLASGDIVFIAGLYDEDNDDEEEEEREKKEGIIEVYGIKKLGGKMIHVPMKSE